MTPEVMNKLAKRAAGGDRDAFGRLLDAVYDRLYALAFRLCGNKADAEDATQEACIRIGRSIGSFRGDAAFSTWASRIAINAANDLLRKRKPHQDLDETTPASGDSPEQIAERQGLWDRVATLPDRERTAILLVYGEGHTQREAALIMDAKEKTVSWYIHEARKKLAEMMVMS